MEHASEPINVIHRSKLKRVEFTFAAGDIFEAGVDAIVSSEQTDFVLSGNPESLSGQIWNRYGDALQRELDEATQGQVLGPGTVIDTSGGQDFKRIFHAGFHDPDDWPDLPGTVLDATGLTDAPREFRETNYFAAIGSCITQILDATVAQKMSSVAFPLIGCGLFGLDEKMLILQFLDAIQELDDRLAEGESLHVWLVIRDRAHFESAAGTFLDLLMQARNRMVSIRVQRIGVPILDRFAARLSQRTNEEWAKWQLCRYAEIAVEMICYGLSRATRPSTTPESLFEEGRAPTFGDFRSKARILATTKMVDDKVWGARFFARVMRDEAAARKLEIINAQRNDLAHGRRSLSLVEIKKHVLKGLQLESWGRIPETDGEFQVLEWQPWARVSSTESGQIGLAAGAVSEAEGDLCHAASGAHLRELLRGNHRYVFTLIHKFQTPEMLCDRPDVIVLTDEAHRSQYDTLALNMRAALPKALFLAFTGTPLIAGEERTKEVFGDYVSIYDFQQSVEDGATVPLFYENRTPELQLVNPDLNENIYDLIEAAELDPEQEAKLERELSRQYHILTRDDRLETVAQDIVQHFLGRGFVGKAMAVSIDKATALKMHDKVKKHWYAEKVRVQGELARHGLSADQKAELSARLNVLTTTDMALIVSPSQNEIAQMKALGLDIEPHRKRMNESQPPLDEKFKDTTDPLRLVFVCAMWLTGFDAPSCSTVYLDKPMRNHTLMQTIARANRVFPGKHSGVIVDYANVFASLEKALAIYGAGTGGKNPVQDKQKLVEELRKAVDEAAAFCTQHQVALADIEKFPAGSLERLQLIEDALNALISPDPVRRDFLGHERLVGTLYRAVKPDPAALEFAGRVACIGTIADAIRAKLNPNPAHISEVMGDINTLLDESITGMTIREQGPPALDLSKIDFEALAKRFRESKRKNTELEVLKAAIRAQLEKLIELNHTRADFAGRREIDACRRLAVDFCRRAIPVRRLEPRHAGDFGRQRRRGERQPNLRLTSNLRGRPITIRWVEPSPIIRHTAGVHSPTLCVAIEHQNRNAPGPLTRRSRTRRSL